MINLPTVKTPVGESCLCWVISLCSACDPNHFLFLLAGPRPCASSCAIRAIIQLASCLQCQTKLALIAMCCSALHVPVISHCHSHLPPQASSPLACSACSPPPTHPSRCPPPLLCSASNPRQRSLCVSGTETVQCSAVQSIPAEPAPQGTRSFGRFKRDFRNGRYNVFPRSPGEVPVGPGRKIVTFRRRPV